MRRLVLAGATALAVAAPASAATNPYGPERVCGSGFHVIDKRVVFTLKHDQRLGTTYLLYNGGTGQNCVASIKAVGLGKKTYTTATIRRQGADLAKTDADFYKYYAGPRKVKAAHTCVIWGGGFSSADGRHTNGFVTGPEHCA